MNYSIRKATNADAKAIADLSLELGYAATTPEIEQRLQLILENKEHCIFVATINSEVIGWIHAFLAYRIESALFAEIGGLVVAETHRKKGVGKLLVEQITSWANENNCPKIRVRCNRKKEDAHIFYLKNGFVETKEQKIFDKDYTFFYKKQ